MDGVGAAASVIAVVDISTKILKICSQYAKEVKEARDEIKRIRGEVADLQRLATEVNQLINGSYGTKLKASRDFAKTIKTSETLLSELEDRLEPAPKGKLMRRIGLRSLKWPFQSTEIEGILQRVKGCSNSISLALQVDQTAVLLDVDSKVDKVDSNLVLGALPSATGAAYNSNAEEHNSTCLKRTRFELLQEIDDWIDDHQAQTIFWLNGMAGTGKSTIARTMASSWDKRGYLGASFFFKRGEADRGNLSRFYTTITRQLVVSTPELAPHVKNAIDNDDSIISKAAGEQFDKLLLQPLLKLQRTSKAVIAVVIDALDECEGDREIRQLINLFTRSKDVLNPRIRVLITSRPELPIRLGFKAVRGNYQDFILHDIPVSIITRDIAVFFEDKLGEIRQNYNSSVDEERRLADDWPGSKNTEALVQKAIPLFIFAATVCRFISQRNCANPEKQLQKVLTHETKSQESKMDATYLPPLEQQLEDLSLREQDEVLDEFQQVVGTIILLETPLSVSALEQLLGIPEEVIYGRLDVLHSVLNFPSTSKSPIRLLHLSFRDFLLDPEKRGTNRFWVDERQTHSRIAAGCLRVMDTCLEEDICNLKIPGIERSKVTPERVASCISMELQYACRYWAHHIQRSENYPGNAEEVLSFLRRHLLHWLEALSLVGRSKESFQTIKILQTLANDGQCKMLRDLVEETHRFVQMNSVIIDLYPLQLYSSLVHSVPSSSILCTAFAKKKPKWIKQLPEPKQTWDERQLILEGPQARKAESLSFDGSRLASLHYDDFVRIWNLNTGECIREMLAIPAQPKEFQWRRERSIKLCRSLIIVTYRSKKHNFLILRSVDTGDVIEQYNLSARYSSASIVERVQLSPNSAFVAFVSAIDTVIILHLDAADTPQQVCLKNSASICSEILGRSHHSAPWVKFSPDSRRIAAISSTGRYAVWDLDTCDCVRQQHDSNVSMQVVSHSGSDPNYERSLSFAVTTNGSILVAFVPSTNETALEPNTVQVRRLDSDSIVCMLGRLGNRVIQTMFSQDHKTLAAMFEGDEIGTWSIETGKCLTLSDAYPHIRHTTLSSDFSRFAMIETFNTISIWRNDPAAITPRHEEMSEKTGSLAISADRALIASISSPALVRVWDIATSSCIYQFYCGCDEMEVILYFTANPQYLLVQTRRQLKLFDTYSGQCIHDRQIGSTRDMTDVWTQIAVSFDEPWIASILDNNVSVSTVDTFSTPRELSFRGAVRSVVLSSDSRLVLILHFSESPRQGEPAVHEFIVSIYSTDTTSFIPLFTGTIKLSRAAVYLLAFDSVSGLLALRTVDRHDKTRDERVEVIRVGTGETVCEFRAHDSERNGIFVQNSTILIWKELDVLVFGDIASRLVFRRLKTDFFFDSSRWVFDFDTQCFHTNIGIFSTKQTIKMAGQEYISAEEHLLGYGLNREQTWLRWNKTNIFWLSPALRPHKGYIQVVGSTIIIGTLSRGVIFFKFAAKKLLSHGAVIQE